MPLSAKFTLSPRRLMLVPVIAVLCAVSASAQTPKEDPPTVSLANLASEFEKSADTIVATVNDTPVTLGTVADRLRDFAPNLAMLPSSMVYKAALEDIVQQRALAVKAKELGVDKDAATKRRIEAAIDHELALAPVRKLLPEMVTDKAIQDRYNLSYANKPGPEEVRFRVIATATETDSNLVIAALNKGASFAEVAKTSSRDPSSINGGEIAFTPREKLKAEIASVVFSLPPGQWSLFPIYPILFIA